MKNRNKLDKNFREEFNTYREKMDIADFNLEAYLELNKKDNRRLISILQWFTIYNYLFCTSYGRSGPMCTAL